MVFRWTLVFCNGHSGIELGKMLSHVSGVLHWYVGRAYARMKAAVALTHEKRQDEDRQCLRLKDQLQAV